MEEKLGTETKINCCLKIIQNAGVQQEQKLNHNKK